MFSVDQILSRTEEGRREDVSDSSSTLISWRMSLNNCWTTVLSGIEDIGSTDVFRLLTWAGERRPLAEAWLALTDLGSTGRPRSSPFQFTLLHGRLPLLIFLSDSTSGILDPYQMRSMVNTQLLNWHPSKVILQRRLMDFLLHPLKSSLIVKINHNFSKFTYCS